MAKLTQEQLQKELIKIELIINSIDQPDRRGHLKEVLLRLAEQI